jgi:hypothetical protein
MAEKEEAGMFQFMFVIKTSKPVTAIKQPQITRITQIHTSFA